MSAGAPLARPAPLSRFRAFLRFFSSVLDAVVQALRSLVSHKLRAALTILGTSIGVMALIAIASALAGMDSSFAAQLSSLGPNTLYVSSRPWMSNGGNWWKFRNRPAIGQFDWRALQSNARLPVAIAPMAGTMGVVAHGEKELQNIQIRGTTEAFLDTGGWSLRRGRFVSQVDHELGTDACIIGADLEDNFFKGQDALGGTLRVGPTTRCTVVGTLVRKGNAFGQSQDALVILPLSAFLRSFGQKRGLTIAVMAPPGKVLETEDEIISVIRNARRIAPDKDDNFSVNRQDKMLNTFNGMTQTLKIVAFLVGFITLIVSGIGIMNILLVSVKERTREIGVRRALGARRTSILLQFLCEAVVVSSLGGFLGTAMGLGVAWILSVVTPLASNASPGVIGLGVGFSISVGLLFGIWPALSAALLHPIEALRYE